MTRVYCILADALAAALLAYAVHLTGLWIIRWRYPEGSGP